MLICSYEPQSRRISHAKSKLFRRSWALNYATVTKAIIKTTNALPTSKLNVWLLCALPSKPGICSPWEIWPVAICFHIGFHHLQKLDFHTTPSAYCHWLYLPILSAKSISGRAWDCVISGWVNRKHHTLTRPRPSRKALQPWESPTHWLHGATSS